MKGKVTEEKDRGRRSHARGTIKISLRKRQKGVSLRNFFKQWERSAEER